VAFWHDISLKLLIWGWLVVLFILPEVIANLIMPSKKVRCDAGCLGAVLPISSLFRFESSLI